MMGFFKAGTWLLDYWWLALIALSVLFIAAWITFGRRALDAVIVFFRFLQSPAGMVLMLLAAGYFCIGFGINMADAECKVEAFKQENRLLRGANKSLTDAIATKDRQIADLNETQRRHSARAAEAAAENQRLQEEIDATPKNTRPGLDRDAVRRVRRVQ